MATRPPVHALTGLRGIAAWWVAIYHVQDTVPLPAFARSFVGDGAFAVDLFFIMSGYVIALSYADAFRGGVGLRRWTGFMLLRLGRIYPLHLLVLGLYLTVPFALSLTGRPVPDWRFPTGYLLQSLLLVQNWGFSTHFSWNLPAWSISAELMFYIAFPLVVWTTRDLLTRWPTLLFTGLVILAWILSIGSITGGLIFETPRFGALRCLSECLLGLWLFHAVALAPPGRTASLGLLAAAAGLAACYIAHLLPDYAALPPAFALLIAALTQPANPLARLLSVRSLLFLGEISFATYIVHYLVKDWTKLLLAGRVPDQVVFAVYVAAVLAMSVLLNRAVEVPARRASRRLAATWLRPGAVPAGRNGGAVSQATLHAP